MARRVFYSFDYERDSIRVQQVKKMGVLAGQPILTSNRWEEVTGGTQRGIKRWIDEQMDNKSCVVVLIGRRTSERAWVQYEIVKGWNDGRGVVGVYIHNLADMNGKQTAKGSNPFWNIRVGRSKARLSTVVNAYDPPRSTSKGTYSWIETNLPAMVENAIKIRREFTR
jgi:Thoeris protein ThsB, TIR-like domain